MALNTISLTSGMRANLFSLQKTTQDMEVVQGRLATGKRVNTALDDPINFFTAQEHNLRASDLDMRKDAMGEAIQTIKAADVGIEGITNLIAQAKSLAQSALSAGSTDAVAYGSQFDTVMTQINEMAADSGYKGINLLQSGELTVQFDATADESTLFLQGFGGSTDSFTIVTNEVNLHSASNWATAGQPTISSSNIQAAIDGLETAETNLRTEAKKLSSNLGVITAREEFTTKMINTLEDGATALTEADMNEEGANMLMLQTRQALSTTSLSMASQAAQSVLRLF